MNQSGPGPGFDGGVQSGEFATRQMFNIKAMILLKLFLLGLIAAVVGSAANTNQRVTHLKLQ